MKLLKCRKGLSPVVAAIILIAVTVAVSIAVAAWMGALTITFMKTEELKITSMTFNPAGATSGANFTIHVRNPGTSKVTINSVTVNDVEKTFADGADLIYESGEEGDIVVICNWVSGNKYKVALLSSTGTVVATYEKIA